MILPALASAYAIFLAVTAAVLSRAPGRRADATDWSHSEVVRFRGGIARTLLVLAGFILAVAAAKQRVELGSLACLGAAALVVGGLALGTVRSKTLR